MSDYQFSENEKQAIASVNLSFDEPMSKKTENDLKETFRRMRTGETSFEEEDTRMVKMFKEAKRKQGLNN